MLQDTLTPELEANLEIISDSFRQQFLRFQRGKAAKTLARHQAEDAAQAAVRHDRVLDLAPSELRAYSITRAIQERYQSILEKRPAQGLEHECHQALAQRRGSNEDPLPGGRILVPADVLSRSMSSIPGAKGGYLTASSSLSFLDLLRSNAVVFQLGAAHVINQVGNVSVAKQLTGATTTWLGASGSAATESEPTFGQLTASPKTVMTFTQKSVQLNRQIDPAGEFFLLRGFAKDLAVAVDQSVINGTGAAQPLGLVNTPTVQTQSGTTLNAGVGAMKQKAAEANAIDENISFLSTPAVRALLENREKAAGGGNFVWAKDLVADRRALVSTNVPTATLICGDWSNVVVIEWNSLEIEVNPFQDFNRGLMGIRAMWLVDSIVNSPASFVVASSIT